LDTETGKSVAIRRFFPFGAGGGGLHADEQREYDTAIERLAGLSHPALRSIICGGCDPVDGMPFIASEWIDGDALEWFVAQGPLSAEAATELITQAMEVCELLSHILGIDAIWVETELQSIIRANDHSDRGFTFWFCPLKWLGTQKHSRGMSSIITLTEQVMGWQGHPINDQAGHGLAAWLKWLRHTEGPISLHEVRQTLAAAVGINPPPTHNLVTQATHPPPRVIKPRPTKSIGLWIVNISLALVVAGLLLYQGKRPSWMPRLIYTQNHAASASTQPALALTTDPATDANPNSLPNPQQAEASGNRQKSAASQNHGVIPWTSRDLLLEKDNQEVVVEGVLADINLSEKETKMYLLFSKDPDKNDARALVLTKTAPEDLSNAALSKLIGKKVRLNGTVKNFKFKSGVRPEIQIKDRASIQAID
jgi:hypothetical protein